MYSNLFYTYIYISCFLRVTSWTHHSIKHNNINKTATERYPFLFHIYITIYSIFIRKFYMLARTIIVSSIRMKAKTMIRISTTYYKRRERHFALWLPSQSNSITVASRISFWFIFSRSRSERAIASSSFSERSLFNAVSSRMPSIRSGIMSV